MLKRSVVWPLVPSLLLLPSCFQNPGEEMMLGSCRRGANSVFGVLRTCEEFFGVQRQQRPQAGVCADNGGVWSEAPCERTGWCGRCDEPRAVVSRTLYYYATVGASVSDEALGTSCESNPVGARWTDNPDVSCK